MIYHVPAVPTPKPRQTRSDKWKKRPCVMRYRAFADTVREHTKGFKCKGHMRIEFMMPFPKSYGNKRRGWMAGTAHQTKPDLDNLIKAMLDALYSDDSVVYSIYAAKYWETHDKPPGITIITDEKT